MAVDPLGFQKKTLQLLFIHGPFPFIIKFWCIYWACTTVLSTLHMFTDIIISNILWGSTVTIPIFSRGHRHAEYGGGQLGFQLRWSGSRVSALNAAWHWPSIKEHRSLQVCRCIAIGALSGPGSQEPCVMCKAFWSKAGHFPKQRVPSGASAPCGLPALGNTWQFPRCAVLNAARHWIICFERKHPLQHEHEA